MENPLPPSPATPPTPTNKRSILLASLLGLGGIGLAGVALAQATVGWGPPPAGDPSAWRAPLIGEEWAIDWLATLEESIHGALEGGDPAQDATPEDELLDGGEVDIPTGGTPSPLFGAGAFEQRMLVFEEFGVERLAAGDPAGPGFPRPTTGPAPEQDPTSVAASQPEGLALDEFLEEPGLYPVPTQLSNVADSNPWEGDVEAFLRRDVETPPAEGRPPGVGWAHQRWDEFYPQVAVKTVQTGARTNGGVRDARQRHGYTAGEFGPGGLYHTVYDTDLPGGPVLEGTTEGLSIRFHPNMPIQDHRSIWTWDGTLPPKLLVGRYGEAILMRHYNGLPIDPSANRGFGLHTITTHEHNGHNPAESDGFANAFYFPGQYYDYRWPMQLAGYDTINTEATDPRAAMPCAPGETLFVNDSSPSVRTCDGEGRIPVRGDWRETMSTHWFHDHMLDFTAQNVYKGNAAMFNYYSAIDRGNEGHDDGVNLRFPSGSALAWGNRDYDINLVLGDKAWDASGQLWFNIFNTDGFLGDQLLTNWLYKPYFEVRARSYRFRILNGSVSRYLSVALVREVAGTAGELAGPPGSGVSYERVGFHLIANDGNILEHALPFDGSMDLDGDGDFTDNNGELPVQAIAERFDIIVDFASQGIVPGDKLYFVNTLSHEDGKRPKERVSLADLLSGAYAPTVTAGAWSGGDPVVGKFLELRVQAYTGTDHSMDPTEYEPGGLQMVPLPIDRNDPALATALHRTFDFDRSGGTDNKPWIIKTDGGAGLTADARRISAAPQLATGPTAGGFSGTNAEGYDALGTMEIWHLKGNGGWSHPVHIHFEEGVILSRGGQPPAAWERWARKDVFRIGPEDDSSHDVEVAFRFREFAGTYVEHCHNTQHEDHAMLLRWDLEHPGQIDMMPAPIPTWDGVEYVNSAALPTYHTGDGRGPVDGIPGDLDPGLPGGGTINWAPVFNPQEDLVVRAGETVTFRAVATDPDGDVVTLSATGLPPGATFDPATGWFTWTPSNSDTGEHQVFIRAIDDATSPRFSLLEVRVVVESVATDNVTLQVFEDWGTGWCGDLVWTNTTGALVEDWEMVVGLGGSLIAVWNAESSAVPGGVRLSPVWYTRAIPAGDTLEVGICAQGPRPSSVEIVLPGDEGGGPDDYNVLATYEEWANWGDASCGDVTLTNSGAHDLRTWTTTFMLPFGSRVYNSWLAEVFEVASSLYEASDLGFNGRLGADSANSEVFGLCIEGPGQPSGFFVSGS